MALTPLTTREYCNIRLSAAGVKLRTDHDPDGGFDFAIQRGTAQVLFYLTRYTVAQLVTSEWVKQAATEFAALALCRLRNNPVPKDLLASVEEWKAMLELIQSGRAGVPDLSPGKAQPQLITRKIVYGTSPSLRTVKPGTTGTPEGYTSYKDPFQPDLYGS